MNLDEAIKNKSQTETGQKLVRMLTEVWGDKEFILGCLVDLPTDALKQKLIDFMDEEEEIDSDTLTLASLDIAEGIEL